VNRVLFAALAAVAVAAAFLLGRLSIPAELYGWDSYPLIAASKFDSMGAFFGTFAEELMDGRYPAGSFYRPVLHLMLGVEHAVGGLSPTIYGATDVAVAALAAILVGVSALRMGLHPLGAALALAFVILNPVADNVVWFMPRRPESLSLLFIAAALALQRPGEAVRGLRLLGTFVAALLAVGSKESGVLVVPLLLVLHASQTTPVRALRHTLPAIAAVALVLLARTAVLGGMGGHPESSFSNLGQVGGFALGQLRIAFGASGAGSQLLWILAPFAAGIVLLLARRGVPSFRAGLWVPLTWLAGNFALSALSGVERDWYAYQTLAPIGLLGAAIISAALSTDEGTPTARKTAGIALALGVAASLAMPIGTAKPVADRSTVDASARRTLDQVEEVMGAVPLGGIAVLQGWQPRVEVGSTSIFLHAPYSLDAYAELVGGPKTVFGRGNPRRRPDQITVRLGR
jgi:hypothetical protein